MINQKLRNILKIFAIGNNLYRISDTGNLYWCTEALNLNYLKHVVCDDPSHYDYQRLKSFASICEDLGLSYSLQDIVELLEAYYKDHEQLEFLVNYDNLEIYSKEELKDAPKGDYTLYVCEHNFYWAYYIYKPNEYTVGMYFNIHADPMQKPVDPDHYNMALIEYFTNGGLPLIEFYGNPTYYLHELESMTKQFENITSINNILDSLTEG